MGPSRTERESSAVFVDLAAFLGLAGIVAGALVLGPTDLGFDPAASVLALLSWIPVTLPIALVILAVSAVDIGAGVVLARAVRGRPFERLDEALLQGFIGAVLKDTLLLSALAGFGLFTQPILIAAHALILSAGVLRIRPIFALGALRRIGPVTPFGALIVAAWAAPVLLQLASPVVPFIDVLPNHVAPAEHLRTFGTLTHLTDTQSPIYGPSRILLGFTALLGTITTGSGLPAGEAIAGFVLPSTLLVAVAVRRLATALGGGGAARWALLTFAMTTSLARLGDVRATVVVLPLAAWSLAVVAERLAADPAVDVRRAGGCATPARRRARRPGTRGGDARPSGDRLPGRDHRGDRDPRLARPCRRTRDPRPGHGRRPRRSAGGDDAGPPAPADRPARGPGRRGRPRRRAERGVGDP